MSNDGQAIAVLKQQPQSLIVVTERGRLLQRATVPRGWQDARVSVYLR
jgi:hypothetical protein